MTPEQLLADIVTLIHGMIESYAELRTITFDALAVAMRNTQCEADMNALRQYLDQFRSNLDANSDLLVAFHAKHGGPAQRARREVN